MQEPQESPQPQLPLSLEQQEQLQKLQWFMNTNQKIIVAWGESHPAHVKPPIYWNEELKDFFWMNRKQRRAL